MEFAFFISIVLLIAYAILALFDGVFLHLYKYRLFAHKESKSEHLIHTLRSLIFLSILLTFYINIEDNKLFFIGLILACLDILVLIFDAYLEKDSRIFMGGLPRWEYILHLLANGFHFAGIAVILVIKFDLSNSGFLMRDNFQQFENYQLFKLLSVNLLPGTIIIFLLHILVLIPKFNFYFTKIRLKCC